MNRFAAVVRRAAFNQFNHAVGQHLRVDAQVPLGFQRHTHCVRNRSNTQLQAGSVRDLLSNQIPDGRADSVQLGRGQHRKRIIRFTQRRHFADMHLRRFGTVRHLLVDFHQNHFCFLEVFSRVRTRDTQAEIAVRIHRRYRNHEHVHIKVFPNQRWLIPVCIGQIICQALAHRLVKGDAKTETHTIKEGDASS